MGGVVEALRFLPDLRLAGEQGSSWKMRGVSGLFSERRKCKLLVTDKGFISFAAEKAGGKKVHLDAAKVMKPFRGGCFGRRGRFVVAMVQGWGHIRTCRAGDK